MKNKARNIWRQVSAKKQILGALTIATLLALVALSSTLVLIPQKSKGASTSDFQHFKKITIDHTMVSADLTNFPVWVYESSDSDLVGFAAEDIAFFASDNSTQLNHEIEVFNSSTGEIGAWVNVTSVSSSTDTVFYMYYGDSDSSSEENPAGVWDGHYVLVLHMNGTGSTVYDSTSYGNDGTKGGTSGTPSQTTGKLGYAQQFVAANEQYINCGHDSSLGLSGTEDFTLECWFKSDNGNSEKIISKDNTSTPIRGWYWGTYGSTDKMRFYASQVNDGSTKNDFQSLSTDDVTDNQWHYGVLKIDWDGDGSNDVFYYHDGSLQGDEAFTISQINPNADMNDLYIGIHQSLTDEFDGIIDEVRISDIARSADWISTCYNTMNNPSSFLSFGSEGDTATSSWSLDGLDGGKITITVEAGSSSWSNASGGAGGTMDIHFNVTASDNYTEVRIYHADPSPSDNFWADNLSIAVSSDNTTWGATTQAFPHGGGNITINESVWDSASWCYGSNPFSGQGLTNGEYHIYVRFKASPPSNCTADTYTSSSMKVWAKRVY